MTEDEMRKKADEFMKRIDENSEEKAANKTYPSHKWHEKNTVPSNITSSKKQIAQREIADYNSIIELQKKLKFKEEKKQDSPKKATNWGCLILFSLLAVLLPLGVFINSFIESSKGNSPWLVGGAIVFLFLILLTFTEGTKRRF